MGIFSIEDGITGLRVSKQSCRSPSPLSNAYLHAIFGGLSPKLWQITETGWNPNPTRKGIVGIEYWLGLLRTYWGRTVSNVGPAGLVFLEFQNNVEDVEKLREMENSWEIWMACKNKIMNGRRNSFAPLNGRRKLERDEDLLLFRELHKREKDRVASLLLPVSDEFEPNGGNYALYRIGSGKKGSGYEFFPENNKNDYDWLKTPPATPLFPSLEMEAANGAELVVQRELPIITQPLSRFADDNEPSTPRNNIGRPKSPNQKPKIPSRSITPSHHRPSIEPKNTKLAQKAASSEPNNGTSNPKPYSNQKDHNHNNLDFLTTNLCKDLALAGTCTNKTKPASARSRVVSPLARTSAVPPQFAGLLISDETPPNLKTDRSTSATRGRPQTPNLKTDRSTSATRGRPQPPNPKTDRSTSSTRGRPQPQPQPKKVADQPSSTPKPTSTRQRQSCSPSVIRGRKSSTTQLEPKQDSNKGTQILGSKMVEKVMNARKSHNVEERDAKQKLRTVAASSTASTKHMGRGKKRDRDENIRSWRWRYELLNGFIVTVTSCQGCDSYSHISSGQ
ncbi:hypothetical protein CCACVL1_28772 [Corchorus capsularis]|uniref:Uncharacterized protein n=1 Tax=Corchorus capsularis TaxID=210143 RepID=A0A1R3G5C5_COCAP|nr:hypothetical protein CCACVL1_28772 [Corchorus capsularis]